MAAWWAEHFQARGYVAVDALHDRIWALSDVSPWYPQNMVLYVHEQELGRYPALAGRRVGPPHDVVHPGLYEIQHTGGVGLSRWVRSLPREVSWTATRLAQRVRKRIDRRRGTAS